MNRYFIGVSISELQQWLADDELPVLTGRVAHGRGEPGPTASGAWLEGLFRTLPAFCLDDPAGVVVAEVGGPDTWKADAHPGIHYLPLSGVKRFIPLTEDAGTALTLRLSGTITLAPAILEREFTFFRISRKSVLARRAGNMFANLFLDQGPRGFTASSVFAGSLPRALMAAEHRKPDEIEDVLRQYGGWFPATWVERAFGETRYDRNNNPISLKSIPVSLRSMAILGVILSSVESVKDQTDKVRRVFKNLSDAANGEGQPLAQVYGDPELGGSTVNFNVDEKSAESVHLLTLALFLRWKLAFLDQRATVDPVSMMKDIRGLSGVMDVGLVADALWLMGAYIGMDNIAPTYRYLHRNEYPAMRFADDVKPLERVQAWQVKGTGQELKMDESVGNSRVRPPAPDETMDVQAAVSGESQPDGHVLAAHPLVPALKMQVQQTLPAPQADNIFSGTPDQPNRTALPSPVNSVPVTAGDTTHDALPAMENREQAPPPDPAVAGENTAEEPVEPVKKSRKLSPASDRKATPKPGRKAKSKPDATPGTHAISAGTDNGSPEGPAKPAGSPEGHESEVRPVKAGPAQMDFLDEVTP